ncbi:MAG TPA: hypothetical protein VM366_15550, partial [Anaerolineae bacterium]|nr:hypothetical protein [Anaerolineae bacterium]
AEIDLANRELDRFLAEELHVSVKSNVIAIAAVLLVIATIVAVVSKVARYVSEVALIRMVSETEATGERHSVWRGFRLGWSRSAWRIYLINVLLGILAVVAGLGLFGLIFGPLPLWVNGSEIVIFTFALSTAGLFFVAIVTMIVFAAVLGVVKRLAWRACAVEGLGVMASIRRGWAVMRQQLKDAGLIWLITLAVGWAWRLAMVPVVLLLLGGGVLLGGLPAVLAGRIASLGTSGDVPVFIAIAVGIPIFLFVMVAPLILLAGLREVFLSSVWTLTYQELRPAEAPQPKQAPEPRVSALGAAPAT